MLARIFNSVKPSAFFSLAILLIIMFVVSFTTEPVQISSNGMPLFNGLCKRVSGVPYLPVFIYLLGISLLSLFLNSIGIQNNFFRPHAFTALFFVLYAYAISEYIGLSAAFFALVFIVLALRRIFAMYNQTTAYSQIFDSALFIGIASLFYLPSIWFMVLVWVSLIIYGQIAWRNWVISILGFITPIFLCYTYLFVFDNTDALISPLKNLLTFKTFSINISPYYYPIIVFSCFLFIISSWSMISSLNRQSVHKRRAFTIVLWAAIIGIGSFFFSNGLASHFLLLTIPFSVMAVGYFEFLRKKWWQDTILLLLLVSILLVHIIS